MLDFPMFENPPQLNTKQSITKQSNTNQLSNSSYELFVGRNMVNA